MTVYKAKPDQTLEEHIAKAEAMFEQFVNAYGKYFSFKELESIKFAIKHHDDGKKNPHFQKKINEGKYTVEGEIPHGILSCAFIDFNQLVLEFDEDYAKAILRAIYNHHNRKFPSDQEILGYINNYLVSYFDQKIHFFVESIIQGNLRNKRLKDEDYWRFAVIKGMLNKIDYAASSNDQTYSQGVELPAIDVFKNVLKKFEPNPCQQYMQKYRDNNIIVIASTGSGKTEGALLWAGENKTFYTLPLKVSIDGLYTRFIKNNYISGQSLGHLHSDTIDFILDVDKDDSSYNDALLFQKRSKAYIYPLTISTIDQLFTFVFKYFGSEIITATLKYSRIVIDEIQSYSPGVLACIIYGLKIITQLGGKFCIMTATLPPYLLDEFKGLGISALEPQKYLMDKIRHNIAIIDDKEFDFEAISEQAKSQKRVLIIVNTVKRAQSVFQEVEKHFFGKIVLLHSRFLKNDRKAREDEIRNYQKLPKSCICISTQIVEASLDIDFDVLYTDMCPADSLLQRLGRCYRKREYNLSEPNVFVLNSDIYKGIYDKDIFFLSKQYLSQYTGVFSEQNKLEYIDQVYKKDNIINTEFYIKYKARLDFLEKIIPGALEEKEVKQKFRDILNVNIIPEKFRNKLTQKLEQNSMQQDSHKRREHEIIKEYSLSIPYSSFNAIQYNQKITCSKLSDTDYYYVDLKYDDKLGLLNQIDDEVSNIL